MDLLALLINGLHVGSIYNDSVGLYHGLRYHQAD